MRRHRRPASALSLALAALALLASSAAAFPTGAGVCRYEDTAQMVPHGAGQGMAGMISVAGTGPFTVTLTGAAPYKGIALWARNAAGNHLGAWTIPANYQNKADCAFGPTLTHTTRDVKMLMDFTWDAAGATGDVVFEAIIVQSMMQWFTMPSKTFTIPAGAGAAAAVPVMSMSMPAMSMSMPATMASTIAAPIMAAPTAVVPPPTATMPTAVAAPAATGTGMGWAAACAMPTSTPQYKVLWRTCRCWGMGPVFLSLKLNILVNGRAPSVHMNGGLAVIFIQFPAGYDRVSIVSSWGMSNPNAVGNTLSFNTVDGSVNAGFIVQVDSGAVECSSSGMLSVPPMINAWGDLLSGSMMIDVASEMVADFPSMVAN